MPLELIIDASLTTRLAAELRNRGRPSRSVAELGGKSLLDPDLLPFLADVIDGDDWLLVTADDAMPSEHGEVILRLTVTIATLHPAWQDTGLEQEDYKREVVHRWAHRMVEQDRGEIRRYSPAAHRPWSPRRR